jgi:ketosteroid isomerase-like protein
MTRSFRQFMRLFSSTPDAVRFAGGIAIVIAVFGSWVGGWAMAGPLDDKVIEQQVQQVETARADAKRRGDATALQSLMLPDFVRINRFGRLLDRQQTAALADDPSYSIQELRIRLQGDAAVATGRETAEAEPAALARFLRVWVREGGGWRELAEEATAVTSETEAARLAEQGSTPVRRLPVSRPGADSNDIGRPSPDASKAREQLRAIERAYRDAEAIDELGTLSRYRASDFSLVDQLGALVSRPQSVHAIIDAVRDDSFGVRVHGRLGVVIGHSVRINNATEATDRFRYMNVWVQRPGGGWQTVAEQHTPTS